MKNNIPLQFLLRNNSLQTKMKQRKEKLKLCILEKSKQGIFRKLYRLCLLWCLEIITIESSCLKVSLKSQGMGLKWRLSGCPPSSLSCCLILLFLSLSPALLLCITSESTAEMSAIQLLSLSSKNCHSNTCYCLFKNMSGLLVSTVYIYICSYVYRFEDEKIIFNISNIINSVL